MLATRAKKRFDVSGYLSDRVYSDKRQLTPDQAKKHKQRALAALKKQAADADRDSEKRKRA